MSRLGLLTVVGLFFAATAWAQPVTVVTEEFPPYDYTDGQGAVQGLSTDVVRAVLGDLDLQVEIRVLPWARAYKLAVENPNTLLFSVVRTEQREPLFHWVGVVCDVRSYIYKLRSRTDIDARALSDLHPYTIGVVRGWAGESYLRDNGFENLEAVADSDLNIKKLIGGRVDLIEDYEANLVYRMKRLGLDPALVEPVHFNEPISGPLHAVFGRNTADTVAREFRAAFEAVHRDGRYEDIQRKWLGVE